MSTNHEVPTSQNYSLRWMIRANLLRTDKSYRQIIRSTDSIFKDKLNIHCNSAIDIGCAGGSMISELKTMGYERVIGIDGSHWALECCDDNVIKDLIIADVSMLDSLEFKNKFDLSICTEFVEHVDDSFSEIIIKFLTRHTNKIILFSGATPGQGGNNHVNEQPFEYWIDLFAKYGASFSKGITLYLRESIKEYCEICWWIEKNITVFLID